MFKSGASQRRLVRSPTLKTVLRTSRLPLALPIAIILAASFAPAWACLQQPTAKPIFVRRLRCRRHSRSSPMAMTTCQPDVCQVVPDGLGFTLPPWNALSSMLLPPTRATRPLGLRFAPWVRLHVLIAARPPRSSNAPPAARLSSPIRPWSAPKRSTNYLICATLASWPLAPTMSIWPCAKNAILWCRTCPGIRRKASLN